MHPTRLTVTLIGASLLPALSAIWWAPVATWWSVGMVMLGIALAIEAVWLWRQPSPEVTREVPLSLPLMVWRPARLVVTNPTRAPFHLRITEDIPEALAVEGLPVDMRLRSRATVAIEFRLRGCRRGRHTLKGCDVLLQGPLGLLTQRRLLPIASPVAVYPNFAEVARYVQLATDNRLTQIGIRRQQRRGEGLEFHQLREYRQGDAPRQIDWKATSRLQKLISREYRDERDQRVLVLLDCGFRMRSQDGEVSHFDQSLNAVLLLAHAVTRQGDAFGFMSFAGQDRFLAPAKGRDTSNRLMNLMFDVEPGFEIPDYLRAAQDLGQRIRKRCLVIVLSTLRDEDSADLHEACQVLGKRHQVLMVSLREALIDQLRQKPLDSVDDALTLAAAEDYQLLRQRELLRLRHAGVLVMDVAPKQLAVGLINEYLRIKSSGLL